MANSRDNHPEFERQQPDSADPPDHSGRPAQPGTKKQPGRPGRRQEPERSDRLLTPHPSPGPQAAHELRTPHEPRWPGEPQTAEEFRTPGESPTPGESQTPRDQVEEPIRNLKARARHLHRKLQAGDVAALARARSLSEFRGCDDATTAAGIRRRHCLHLIANEFGFRSWTHALAVLSGQRVEDFGTLLYPKGGAAHGNVWLASYDAAAAIRRESGGYLLAYQRHYFIVDRYFIETLGLDPEDADWAAIGRDWARPTAPAARTRLYGRLIARRPASEPIG